MISPLEPGRLLSVAPDEQLAALFIATIARVFADQETLPAIPGGFGGGER
jgi:hypothetical protein